MIQIQLSDEQARIVAQAEDDVEFVSPDGQCVATVPAPLFTREEIAECKLRTQKPSRGVPYREVIDRVTRENPV